MDMHRDIFMLKGLTFRVRTEHDDFMGKPWEEDESAHGPVRGWARRESKAPGELVLAEDGRLCLFYDFAAACRIARAEGWDAPPYGEGTPRQRAARAARRDFERLRDYCAGHWAYCGVVVELLDVEGEPTGETASLWGIEDDSGKYLDQVAEELVRELADRFPRQKLLTKAQRIRH